MTRSGLFLAPEEMQALIRKAHADRSQMAAHSLKRAFVWLLLRRPASVAIPISAGLPDRLQARLDQHWAGAVQRG
jgi:hypothetical protein